jgi:hypothetical protein
VSTQALLGWAMLASWILIVVGLYQIWRILHK